MLTNDILQFAPFVQGVFTTEAVRDAAITSPTEGMHAYITASTIAAAAGDTYAGTPTGIQTIYNGAEWVCVTPVGAMTDTLGTTASTSFTATLASGGTNPSVTLRTGTSALVSISCHGSASTTQRELNTSFAVSGATTLNPTGLVGSLAARKFGAYVNPISANVQYFMGRTILITGLTGGTNTFALNYNTDSTTGSWTSRSITVQGIA